MEKALIFQIVFFTTCLLIILSFIIFISIKYDDRINYNLTNEVIICSGCSISKISIDDYEIDKNEYSSYLRGLTPGEYTFVYKITKGDIEISKLRIIKIEA